MAQACDAKGARSDHTFGCGSAQDAGLGGQVYDRESVMKGMGGMGMPGMGGGAASRVSTALLRACMVVVRANHRVGMLGLSGGAAVANP